MYYCIIIIKSVLLAGIVRISVSILNLLYVWSVLFIFMSINIIKKIYILLCGTTD